MPPSFNSFWIPFLLLQRYALAPSWHPLLHPCRDLCLLSVCLSPAKGCPRGAFHYFSQPSALWQHLLMTSDSWLFMPFGWDPLCPPPPSLLPCVPSPTAGLQQRARCLLRRHHRTLQVCIIDQRALIRIVLSVSELTRLGARWGLTPSGCNFPHFGNLFFLLPEYPPAIWDLLGWSDRQCQLLTSQPVLDTHRRGQPRFPGCWHHLLSSPFLPYLAQFAVWFYLWRHLCVYNHDQLLHLHPTGMLLPLFCHLAGNGHIFRV